MSSVQTILGAGGAIGSELARVLPRWTDRIRLVRRSPAAATANAETLSADLTDRAQTFAAVQGSQVCYLVAGLPYDTRVWEALWPRIMRNTLAACAAHGARLVFFDNVYMYDRDHLDGMDETTPVRPTSRKGAVRAQIAQMLMDAVAGGRLEGLIARSADFYGPGRQQNSVLGRAVFDRLAAGRAAQWLMSADRRHSFTYTPDAALATAMLGNASDVWGDVWHLPTAPAPWTGRQWVERAAQALGAAPRLQVAGPAMMALMGPFIPPLRELRELAYQYDRDYVFRSERFARRFDFAPTHWEDGLRTVLTTDYTLPSHELPR